jgi:hypothetical protein
MMGGGEVKTDLRGRAPWKTPALLLALCCLVPLAALAAVFYLAAPAWLVSLLGLLALVLLARRLMAVLDAPVR